MEYTPLYKNKQKKKGKQHSGDYLNQLLIIDNQCPTDNNIETDVNEQDTVVLWVYAPV